MDCIFCKIINKEIKSNIVYEDDLVVSILDINPKAKGHILIIPKKHYEDYKSAGDVLAYMYKIAEKLGDKIMDTLKQKGYSLIINYGDAQEVKHLHLHLIPTNKDKKIDLEDIYKKIKM